MLPTEWHASRKNFILMLVSIPLILLIGYGLMGATTLIFPMTADSTGTHLLVICSIIILALAVPYFILKVGFHTAHITNPNEEELKLKDFPKEEKTHQHL
jgi:hypothetical protein